MIKLYNTDIETNKLERVNTYNRGTWIHMVDPSEDEIKEVCQNVNIKEDFIRYALDNEEKARIDIEDEDDTILFIIDIPVLCSFFKKRSTTNLSVIPSTMIFLIFGSNLHIANTSEKFLFSI